MRTKANQNFAFEVVDYFENVANRSKTETYDYFIRGKKKNRKTVYMILQRYFKTGSVNYSKNRGYAPTKLNAETIEEYQRLLEIDPNLSLGEAAHRLNIDRRSVQRLKKKIKALKETESRTKENDYGTGNDEAVDNYQEASMLGSYDGGSPVPGSPNQITLNEPGSSTSKFKGLENTKEWMPIQPRTTKFSQCFICMENFVDKNQERLGKSDGTNSGSELTENLDASVLLLKVLGVSPDTMTNLMKKSKGKGPKDWLSSCSTCDGIMQEAVFLQKQIHSLEDKLRKAKSKITQKIKRSSRGKKGRRKLSGENGMIGMMVRKYVMTNANPHHQAKNPFLNGDLEAESRVEIQKVKVKVERVESTGVSLNEADLGEGDDFDDDTFVFANEMGSEDKVVTKEETRENDGSLSPVGSLSKQEEKAAASVSMSTAGSASADSLESFHFETGPYEETLTNLEVLGNVVESGSVLMSEIPIQPSTDSSSPACNVAETTHKPSEELVECDVCQKQMKPITLPMHKLREHKIVMEGFTKKECSVAGCPYVTLYDDQLEIHKTRHPSNKSRSFSCQFCGKSYTSQTYLKVHEELHRNESKPFQCDVCGKAFASKRYLYTHVRWHQGRLFPSALKRYTFTRRRGEAAGS